MFTYISNCNSKLISINDKYITITNFNTGIIIHKYNIHYTNGSCLGISYDRKLVAIEEETNTDICSF